jgi:hypothetical protein
MNTAYTLTTDSFEAALVDDIVEDLADYFATQNNRFDRERFYEAAGYRDVWHDE